MAHLFDKVLNKTRSKTPGDLVSKLVAALERLTDSSTEKTQEEIAKYLAGIKVSVFGDDEAEANREAAHLVSLECCKYDLPRLVTQKLPLLDFESRKDAAQVCGAVFRMDAGQPEGGPGVDYILRNRNMLDALFQGYGNPAIALNCGSMLRDCARNQAVAKLVLDGPLLQQFFEKVEVSNFEVASDAFSTFKDLLTRHKQLVATFVSQHYDEFFGAYAQLLASSNYVTKRQSLKLLGELLLDRSNTRIMMQYVADVGNLKQMMQLLSDASRSIQFEAFHVFKVFVANPNKSAEVVQILTGNKDRLLRYLGDFHMEKDDEQFKEEKAVIIKELSMLQAPEPEAA